MLNSGAEAQEACHNLKSAWAMERDLDSENKRKRKRETQKTSSRMLKIGFNFSSF